MADTAIREPPIDPALFLTADFWHAAKHSATVAGGFKEWSHFSVLAGGFDLLVNFSLMGAGTLIPRLTLLFGAVGGIWEGDVVTFPPDQGHILEGLPDIALGCNSARLVDGCYHVQAGLPARDIAVALKLRPITRPVVANNVRLSDSETVRWMVVPRLQASGMVSVAGRDYRFADAPAYHDRNWGQFAWGGAFAWEWATILPEDASQPWCLVYSRITNRNRGTTLSQSLILWRRAFPRRKFYGRDLTIVHEHLLRRDHALRLPRPAALMLHGSAVDVPGRIEVTARGYGDELRVHMEFQDFARIAVPNDHWPGFTTLCEIIGRTEVTGRIGNEPVAFQGRVQAEFNHFST